jgi:hypothetical protein
LAYRLVAHSPGRTSTLPDRPLQAYARLWSFGSWIDPGSLRRLRPSAWPTHCGEVPFDSAHLVENNIGLLGELGPFAGRRAVPDRFEYPVGQGDLVTSPVGLWAPPGPGRYSAVVAVERGF